MNCGLASWMGLAAVNLTVDGLELPARKHEMIWRSSARHQTQTLSLSGYQWNQNVDFSVDEPCLVTIRIDMLFSDSDSWHRVDGAGRLLVDRHAVSSPRYYSTPAWHLRRLLRLPHDDVRGG